MVERQELYCHNCGNYVQFDMDMSLNGNHILRCPVCGHEHCRVVKDGVITNDRWDQRNSSTSTNTIPVGNVTFSTTSTFTMYMGTTATVGITGGTSFIYNSWLNVSSI